MAEKIPSADQVWDERDRKEGEAAYKLEVETDIEVQNHKLRETISELLSMYINPNEIDIDQFNIDDICSYVLYHKTELNFEAIDLRDADPKQQIIFRTYQEIKNNVSINAIVTKVRHLQNNLRDLQS